MANIIELPILYRNFNLKREHIISGDSSLALVATYQPNNAGRVQAMNLNTFLSKDSIINTLMVKYIHINAPIIHWNWMKQFVLEDSTSDQGKKSK